MVFRKIDDFMKAFDQNVERTAKVFGALDDAALGQAVAEGHRTAGQIAWHVVTTIPEMMSRTGLPLSAVDPHSAPPASAAEVRDGYRRAASDLRRAVGEGWSDETLLAEDELYGERWARGLTLAILMAHETHHVGQITVLLRQAGRRVPGIMGPSKEEWAQYGMEAPPF